MFHKIEAFPEHLRALVDSISEGRVLMARLEMEREFQQRIDALFEQMRRQQVSFAAQHGGTMPAGEVFDG